MSQNDKIWEINGLSLELDLTDADVVERYETALEIMQDKAKSTPKDGKKSAQIRAECNIIYSFFEHIFGAETADKIFKDIPISNQKYMDMYYNFIEFAVSQGKANADYIVSMITKYTPNRQQRRTQQRRAKKK